MSHLGDDCIGEEGVEPHSGCQSDWIVGKNSHQQTAERSGKARRNERGVAIHSCIRQYRRIYEDDVGHREERRDPRERFATDRRSILLKLEIFCQCLQNTSSP